MSIKFQSQTFENSSQLGAKILSQDVAAPIAL
jgi:hypothetical protein